MVRLLKFNNPEEIKSKMQQIGVDRYGVDIMLPKTNMLLLEVDKLSSIGANILKQELLSLGADAAVSRASITGKSQESPVFIFGTYAQLNRLTEKLKKQPFGLNRIGLGITGILQNAYNCDFKIRARNHRLDLTKKTHIMGIVNVKPDSFSASRIASRRFSFTTTACGNQYINICSIAFVHFGSAYSSSLYPALLQELSKNLW